MRMAPKLLFLMAMGLALVSCAMADDKKSQGGPCAGGYWPDGKGCCPEMIDGKAYYRDGNKCYPKDVGCGVYYADGNGCYPDEKGNYAKAGESCPWERKCHDECIRPEEDCNESTTTEKRTTPKYETTTRKEYTTERRTTPKHETTTEECKETTTTERRTTPKRTTTEECKETTSTERRTTPKRTTTEECKESTTSQKYHTTTEKCDEDDNKQCPGGQWKDGNGCCPRKLAHEWFYRDGRGCYPIELDCGVFYADGNGCYPDEHGQYLKAGDYCPKERQCKKQCDGGHY